MKVITLSKTRKLEVTEAFNAESYITHLIIQLGAEIDHTMCLVLSKDLPTV